MPFQVAPDICARVAWCNPSDLEVCSGSGSSRRSHLVSSPQLVATLLTLGEVESLQALGSLLADELDIASESAFALASILVEEGLLVPSESVAPHGEALWRESGWQDALDFHRATQHLTFNRVPEEYARQMRARLAASARGEDVPQPGPYKYHASASRVLLPLAAVEPSISIGHVFRSTIPFTHYGEGPITIETLGSLLNAVYGVTQELTGLLGPYFKRTSPSGGARHPTEAYVVATGVSGLPPGVYHYLPLEHSLESLRYGNHAHELTEICFNKPGIETASATVVLTARWFRHMWKYRYARSYRMVLLDVGHLIQSHIMVATSLALQTFPCPSLHDSRMSELLSITDVDEEGVMYALGVGPLSRDNNHPTFFAHHAY